MIDRRFSLLSDDDVYWFNEGRHLRLYEHLGAHLVERDGRSGVSFAVWAPDALTVSVVGDFNAWSPGRHPLSPRGSSGIWEGFIEDLEAGSVYKYQIESRYNGYRVQKADPYGFYAEEPPRTASRVWSLDYSWQDGSWMASRLERQALDAPISIYEVHFGSWRHVADEERVTAAGSTGARTRPLTYREMAKPLTEYVKRMGFTHVEFLPLMEHPFYGSWGYQTTGFFAATSRYGRPQDLMYLIDYLHQNEIGVILDWVPSHFPSDEHGLGYFDGTHLYEHASREQGFQPDWGSLIFNYGRPEVRSFLLSSAIFWMDQYHADGLRVDAVASILYLDYSRKAGEWRPNKYGGRENLEAIDFLRQLNQDVHREFEGALVMAEESTAWPMVSKPTYLGGLGFSLKWDMGWMHDTLQYMSLDPVHRRFHQGEITFRQIYAYTENFVLPLSHDEVVHGKGSLANKMPGDDWQKLANLRLLYAYMTAQPGKKLLFMGGEFAQWSEWAHESSLDWHLTQYDRHQGIQQVVADLNGLYRSVPALHEGDIESFGFQWIDANDSDRSVLTFLRKAKEDADLLMVACNFTPLPRYNYRIGLPKPGRWLEVFNSDAETYGGSDVGNMGSIEAAPVPYQGHRWSAVVTLPPLAAVYFRPEET